MEAQSRTQKHTKQTIRLQGIRIEVADREPNETELDAFLNLLASIARRAAMEAQSHAA